jgi:anaphase-promoting complex subunit 11
MPPRVSVAHVVGVAQWSWRMGSGKADESHVCGICHAPTDAACPTCTLPGDACPLLLGVCTHGFHMHCILKWLAQQPQEPADVAENVEGRCPMCRQEWRVAAEES